MTALALPRTVADLIEEHDDKSANIDAAIADFDLAWDRLILANSVQGAFVETIASKPHLSAAGLRKKLLRSGWQAVYHRLDVGRIATAKDKLRIKADLANPPPLEMGTVKATFGDYLVNPRFHILRGLAECFTGLDPAYKSHAKVRIGVKGLPKRIILNGWGEYSYGHARDRFSDMVNALALYRGQSRFEYAELASINELHRHGSDAVLDGAHYSEKGAPGVDRGITVRRFANGNAHVFFDKWALFDINKALAEFYGEVLPDVDPDAPEHAPSTAVSKDLQFYWSPPKVIEAAMDYANIGDPRQSWRRDNLPTLRVLEPSCGDGRILDALKSRQCQALGIEYHAGRAAEARAKGHAVVTGNFLDQPPVAEFDRVVMNPPFYGRHYAKHVRHAERFLKPGGMLVAILPASARYDHDELSGDLNDLPVASFAEAGTNVPTTMLRIVNRETRA